jgi:uncharacterized protein YgiM (DUF1202 family)
MTLNAPTKKLLNCLLVGIGASLFVVSTATPNYAAKKSVCSFITGNGVNVRSGAGNNFKVIKTLKRGDVVTASHRQGNWVRLTALNIGTTDKKAQDLNGWVSNRFINGCSEDKFDMWRK